MSFTYILYDLLQGSCIVALDYTGVQVEENIKYNKRTQTILYIGSVGKLYRLYSVSYSRYDTSELKVEHFKKKPDIWPPVWLMMKMGSCILK